MFLEKAWVLYSCSCELYSKVDWALLFALKNNQFRRKTVWGGMDTVRLFWTRHTRYCYNGQNGLRNMWSLSDVAALIFLIRPLKTLLFERWFYLWKKKRIEIVDSQILYGRGNLKIFLFSHCQYCLLLQLARRLWHVLVFGLLKAFQNVDHFQMNSRPGFKHRYQTLI